MGAKLTTLAGYATTLREALAVLAPPPLEQPWVDPAGDMAAFAAAPHPARSSPLVLQTWAAEVPELQQLADASNGDVVVAAPGEWNGEGAVPYDVIPF